MPTYVCEKCARVFDRKSGYNDHMKKKNDCAQKSMITAVIESKVEEKVKEVVRATMQKEITKETLPSFFEALHNLLWNKAGLSPERALEHMTFFFAYRLIEPQADVLNLPQECRWSYLASHKDENDTYKTMKKGCEAFQKNKITKPFFKKPEIDKATIIYEIVEQISRISLTILQETDTLGDIFEYMLGRGMSTMANEGQYFTNRSICKLAFKLAYDIKKTLRRADGSLCTFADWFCGTGGFPAEFVKGVNANDPSVHWTRDAGSLFCQDMNLSSVTTTLLNMLILTGIPFSGNTIRGSNSFADAITMGAGAPFPGLTIDYCFMNPPYGGDKTKGKEYKFAYSKTVKGDERAKSKKFFVNQEIQSIGIEDDDKVSAGVQLAMSTLSSDGGICVLVLWAQFFFGASKKCVELRKKIAEEYRIHSVVDIPSGAFKNTGTKTSMLIFQKGVGATERITFMGLDEKVLVEVTLEELRMKNYSLNYKQYLPQSAVEVDGFEMVKLGDIVSFKAEKSKKDKNAYAYIDIGSVDKGKLNLGELIPKNELPGRAQYSVNVGDILLGTVRPNLEHYLQITSQNYRDNLIVSNGFSIMRCDTSKVLPTYLYSILTLPSTTAYLTERATGTTYPVIDDSIIGNIQIPLPSIEKQQEIMEHIDFYTQLAHTEEQSLKILEKIVMGWVKEMGRGKERVKLGEVCEIHHGKRVTKKEHLGTLYPVYGGGNDTFRTDNKNREGFTCKVSRFGISEHNCVQTIDGDYWLMDSGFTVKGISEKTIDVYIYYWLLQNKERVYQCGRATAQMNMDMDTFRDLEIPLPSLTEQQTLQSDFDEIRHKHVKIAEYKAKAQEAIQRLIPGTKKETEKVEANQIIVPITMSHTSTCEVEEDGSGCTCRLPLTDEDDEKEDMPVVATVAAVAAVTPKKMKRPTIAK
jgi:type I restriction-modification system DNA methylase subunit/restriction endonuclease S subunit